MTYRLACADFTFPLLSHENVLALVSMLQFDGIDIGLFEDRSHLQPTQMFANVSKNAKVLRNMLHDNNLESADIFLQAASDFISMASNHPDANIRRKARAWYLDSLEFTLICGGKHTTGLPGVYFQDEPEENSYVRACEEMAWRFEKAKENGIVFSVEPHLGSIIPSPKTAEQFVKDVPGLTLTLDYTHFTKIGMQDNEIEPLLQYSSHFHARGATKGFLQTSFKKNTIDYKRVLREMNKTNYKGFIGIEYIWIDWEKCNEVDNISEVILFRDFFNEQMSAMI
jgi:sugar phosphate isomerase/epimerase